MQFDEEPTRKGPELDRLKIEGAWTDAVAKAMRTPRPADGWQRPARYAERKPKTHSKEGGA